VPLDVIAQLHLETPFGATLSQQVREPAPHHVGLRARDASNFDMLTEYV
jgi:hypothetical protein